MKLIIVQRGSAATYRRLKDQFADDLEVEVVFEQRLRERRQTRQTNGPERRGRDRRRLSKEWNGRDYIVIQIANSKQLAYSR